MLEKYSGHLGPRTAYAIHNWSQRSRMDSWRNRKMEKPICGCSEVTSYTGRS